MSFETRKEVLTAIHDAGRRNARVEFMRIVSMYPIDFATAMETFREGLRMGGYDRATNPDIPDEKWDHDDV